MVGAFPLGGPGRNPAVGFAVQQDQIEVMVPIRKGHGHFFSGIAIPSCRVQVPGGCVDGSPPRIVVLPGMGTVLQVIESQVLDLGFRVLEGDRLQIGTLVHERADHFILAISVQIGGGNHRIDDEVPVVAVISPAPVNDKVRFHAVVVQFVDLERDTPIHERDEDLVVPTQFGVLASGRVVAVDGWGGSGRGHVLFGCRRQRLVIVSWPLSQCRRRKRQYQGQ